jgi:hypothetical protein
VNLVGCACCFLLPHEGRFHAILQSTVYRNSSARALGAGHCLQRDEFLLHVQSVVYVWFFLRGFECFYVTDCVKSLEILQADDKTSEIVKTVKFTYSHSERAILHTATALMLTVSQPLRVV